MCAADVSRTLKPVWSLSVPFESHCPLCSDAPDWARLGGLTHCATGSRSQPRPTPRTRAHCSQPARWTVAQQDTPNVQGPIARSSIIWLPAIEAPSTEPERLSAAPLQDCSHGQGDARAVMATPRLPVLTMMQRQGGPSLAGRETTANACASCGQECSARCGTSS